MVTHQYITLGKAIFTCYLNNLYISMSLMFIYHISHVTKKKQKNLQFIYNHQHFIKKRTHICPFKYHHGNKRCSKSKIYQNIKKRAVHKPKALSVIPNRVQHPQGTALRNTDSLCLDFPQLPSVIHTQRRLTGLHFLSSLPIALYLKESPRFNFFGVLGSLLLKLVCV